MRFKCYILDCENPIKSKTTMACVEHAIYVCEICGTKPPGRVLHRDHDHVCRKMCVNCFRGFLCPNCNTGLGMFKDNTDLLRAAIAYLDRDRPKINRVPRQR